MPVKRSDKGEWMVQDGVKKEKLPTAMISSLEEGDRER